MKQSKTADQAIRQGKCAWCSSGHVVQDQEENTVSHSVPACEGFRAWVRALSSTATAELQLLGTDGKPLPPIGNA